LLLSPVTFVAPGASFGHRLPPGPTWIIFACASDELAKSAIRSAMRMW
jgi:hypothetical protein